MKHLSGDMQMLVTFIVPQTAQYIYSTSETWWNKKNMYFKTDYNTEYRYTGGYTR